MNERLKDWFKRPAFWFTVVLPLVFLFFALSPWTKNIFLQWTGQAPYPMAFLKFSLLATVGETLANWLNKKEPHFVQGAFFKAIVWGVIGCAIALIFPIFVNGITAVQQAGLLPGSSSPFLTALFTSIFLNFTFGIVMMAAHRITDAWIDGVTRPVVNHIDWPLFWQVVVFRTIPLFWIPAHTLTFLLPAGFRVVWSAFLSIALGLILALTKRKKQAQT